MPVAEAVIVLVVPLRMGMPVTGVCLKIPVPFTLVLVVIGVFLSNRAER